MLNSVSLWNSNLSDFVVPWTLCVKPVEFYWNVVKLLKNFKKKLRDKVALSFSKKRTYEQLQQLNNLFYDFFFFLNC